MNSILVVGSAALDTIETAAGKADDCVGGSALYFTAGASLFAPVSVVSVVGKDFPHKKISLNFINSFDHLNRTYQTPPLELFNTWIELVIFYMELRMTCSIDSN